MDNLIFLLLALLFVVSTQADDAVKPKLTLRMPPPLYTAVGRTDIKGRLLTPEEGCGYSAKRIPRAVKNGAWPWSALLGQKVIGMNLGYKSSGSLITTRHVLTSARYLDRTLNFVRLGEFNSREVIDGKFVDIDIVRQELHEKWNANLKINDIAIVYLAHDVIFTDRISPVCLPMSDQMQRRNFIGATPFESGWAHMPDSKMSNVWQLSQFPVIANGECKQKYKKIGRFQDNVQFSNVVLCAGFTIGARKACPSFTGGSLILPVYENGKFPYYQIGIRSYGEDCTLDNVPTVYTNVQRFTKWIQEKLLL